MKPQYRSIVVGVLCFVEGAQRSLVIFCWLLPNMHVENFFFFCFTFKLFFFQCLLLGFILVFSTASLFFILMLR